ncbi:MCE family protein [Actinokineospora iranica]|uniref:Virulence factor Mce family protein n=1 Tax=Actinokineospora iranica TaxID=1271860 RepID=A0A1G6YTN6_9PSEU|nr:MCE family protein [Actinokineospora iranica]SDD93005.1 virulence factor Mce family protein [Actinokineospora iranica]
MATTKRKARLLRLIALGAVAVMVVAAGTWALVNQGKTRSLTAYFAAAVGLYAGSDVRVLGVAVGTVDSVEPQGPNVKVVMTIDADAPVPENANALVVTPSLVSDRYVQLAPVLTSGKRIADGTVIPLERTVVPVELDELFSSLDRLTTALGPEGANTDGAFSDLIRTTEEYLRGNGADMGQTVRDLGDLARTLNGSQDDLFTTIDSLSKFAALLAANDDKVRQIDDQLSSVTQFLADERATFDAALKDLSVALGAVEGFIKDNRARIKSNVDKLAGTTKLLSDQRASLAEALDTAPLALTNVVNAYDPATHTIDGRANLNEYSMLPLPRTADAQGGN